METAHDDNLLNSRARRWRDEDPDASTRAEVDALLEAGDIDGLRERFDQSLSFGTAGLRGVLGAGPNRMNRQVVIRTTAGLVRHLEHTVSDLRDRGVVVGRDGRHGSETFARDVAEVLAGAGVPVWILDGVVATPLVGFAVLDHRAAAGVMITASHNPPEYNGYKVYGAEGAQIVTPHDEAISRAAQQIESLASVPRLELEQAISEGLVRVLGSELVERYFRAVSSAVGAPSFLPLRIVYSPLHGVGGRFTPELLRRAGFTDVVEVPEQREPNPDFPTVRFPNPEEPGALDLALSQAAAAGADLVLVNDPDADRLAVAVADGSGGFRVLGGNEIGVLLGHHVMTKALAAVGDDAAARRKLLVITTIVSSSLLPRMAERLGLRCARTLTGFKWMAHRALHEELQGAKCLFAYEEALGFAIGTAVRDKDGISAALVFAQLAAELKAEGKTVLERLQDLHRTYGVAVSSSHSVHCPGPLGMQQSRATMARLRNEPPRVLADEQVVSVVDHFRQLRRNLSSPNGNRGERWERGEPLEGALLPRADVVVLELAGGARIIARPSGTEPKIKYYLELVEPASEEPVEEVRARASARMARLLAAFVESVTPADAHGAEGSP